MPDFDPEIESEEVEGYTEEPGFSEGIGGEEEEEHRGMSLDEMLEKFKEKDFKDATPEYVNKTPNTSAVAGEVPPVVAPPVIDPNQVVGPNTASLTQRMSNDQVAGRIPPVATSSATSTAKTVGKVGDAASKVEHVAESIDPAGAALMAADVIGDKIGGKLGKTVSTKAKEGILATEVVATAGVDVIADAELIGLVAKEKWDNFRKRWKYVLGLGIVGASVALFVGLSFGNLAARLRGNAGGSLGIGAGSFSGSNQYLSIMTDHLTFNRNGSSTTLSLSATYGGYSAEDTAKLNSTGHPALTTNGSVLRAEYIYDPATGKSSQWTQDQLNYYITMRWPYSKYYWADCGVEGGKKVTPDAKIVQYYYGRKIVLYNAKTNKAIIGMAGEEGPGVWTGLCGKTDKSGVITHPDHTQVTMAAQKQLWQSAEPRDTVPTGWEGRVVGGPAPVSEYLFNSTDPLSGNDEKVSIGFLDPKYDNLPIGPVDAANIHVLNGGTNTPIQTPDAASLSACIGLARSKDVSFSHTNDYAGFLIGQIVRLKGAPGYPIGQLVPLDTKMCALMQTFASSHPGVKINFNSVVGTHPPVTGNNTSQSRHWTGHGMDLNVELAGIIMPWIIQNAAQLTAAGIMPRQVIGPKASIIDGKNYTQYAVNGGKNAPGFFVAGHDNHVHIGF